MKIGSKCVGKRNLILRNKTFHINLVELMLLGKIEKLLP